jgi:hypothetical protein
VKLDSPWAVPQVIAGVLAGYALFDLAVQQTFSLWQAVGCVILGVSIVLLARRLTPKSN